MDPEKSIDTQSTVINSSFLWKVSKIGAKNSSEVYKESLKVWKKIPQVLKRILNDPK